MIKSLVFLIGVNMAISKAFKAFLTESAEHAEAWRNAVEKLSNACRLDDRTECLANISLLASTGIDGGLPYQVKRAKQLGIAREEVISAILLGLPIVGNKVINSLPMALESYDGVYKEETGLHRRSSP